MKSLFDLVAQLVDRAVGQRIDYSRPYRAEVVMQHGDGCLDLRAIDKRADGSTVIPDLTRVPIAYGEPGVRAKVKKGAIVFVEFAAGDPSQPVVRGWASGSVDELSIDANLVKLAGDRSLARKGDQVVVFITPAMAGTIATGPTGAIPVTGYILDGSNIVKGG